MTLDTYLDIWAEWMKAHDGPDAFRIVAAGCDQACSNYAVAVDDADAAADVREFGYGPVVDAAIDSLAPHERWAICVHFELSTVLVFPRVDARLTYWLCRPRLAQQIRMRLPLEDEEQPEVGRAFDG